MNPSVAEILFDDREDGVRLDRRTDDSLLFRVLYGNMCKAEVRYVLLPDEIAAWEEKGEPALRELAADIRANEKKYRHREVY